jgi:hypothetical protein
MAAGNTATISIDAFRADWLDHTPIVHLCSMYSITKDQVIRLRDVWALPPRHDRKLRAKPKRQVDPSPVDIEAACLRIQATWDERTREMRAVQKSQHVTLRRISLYDVDEPAPEEEP